MSLQDICRALITLDKKYLTKEIGDAKYISEVHRLLGHLAQERSLCRRP
jgi:hypothetical protein